MAPTVAGIARNEFRRLGREDCGVAVMFVLCLFLFLYVLCASVWFYGENVRRRVELQNACDAAAYSAAVVQADGLSRMAVVNRAMSWSYVQMTKMQMDYITLRWLELTRERYEKDWRNTRPTPFGRMFSNRAGYHTLSHEWKQVPNFIRYPLEHGWIYFNVLAASVRLWLSFDCQDDTHNEANDKGGNGSYIGFRIPGDGGSHLNTVLLVNEPAPSFGGTYLKQNLLSAARGERQLDEAVESLQDAYGEGGALLGPVIDAMKNLIVSFNALLPTLNRQMAGAIEETAVRTLFENLPRDENGLVDEAVLRDCHWMVAGGASRPPEQYASGLGNLGGLSDAMCFSSAPYFSGLNNTEEDELVFLNMADGLPEWIGNRNVCLADYFSDVGHSGARARRGLAAGLDQWFIRCDPHESAVSNQIAVTRKFDTVRGGIVRAYKNANYDEGRSGGSLVQNATGFGQDIHRGNYVTDISRDASGAVRNAFEGLEKVLSFSGPSSLIDPGPKGRRWSKKRLKHRAKKALKQALSPLDAPMQAFLAPVKEAFGGAKQLAGGLIDSGVNLDVRPSAVNDRLRFVDKCANVRDTTGLVSEYEWASAYWFCTWGRVRGHILIWPFDIRWCLHPFFPAAAVHGGRKDAKPNHPLHTKTEIGTNAYFKNRPWSGGFLGTAAPWLVPQFKMFTEKGKSRADYRSSFVSMDGDIPEMCHGFHNTWPWLGLGGGKSGYLFKGFVRIYGDDKAVYDGRYQGVPCQPWVLNKKFFEGAGSIVVGVSRKQRNVFDELFPDRTAEIQSPQSLYSAFNPADARQNFVALSVGRAGYAPRTGTGRADGPDSIDAGSDPARVFEVRYDSVLDRKLGGPDHRPDLPDVPGITPAVKEQVAGVGRIGCVCGTDNTTHRLRHQWNLSQTDWDGVLLPLRHAHAKHESYDSADRRFGGDGADALSAWKFSPFGRLGDRDDAVSSVVDGLLWEHARWRPFDVKARPGRAWMTGEEDDRWFPTEKILPLPSDLDDASPADLFRKRRIL